MKVGPDISPALLDALKREGLDSVGGAFAYGGGEELIKANLGHRRRIRLTLTDIDGGEHVLYMKLYDREGLAARLRRWWTYGRRVSPAEVEFDNIQTARAAGVPTAQAVICDSQPGPLDPERSYMIMTSVPGQKLEACMDEFMDRCGGPGQALEAFTKDLAALVRKFHAAGLVHRDLYSSHVFLDDSDGRGDLYLIDLARVFRPKWRAMRWRVKDLAQLKYSQPLARWVATCWETFLRQYLGSEGRWKYRFWNWRINLKVAMMRRPN